MVLYHFESLHLDDYNLIYSQNKNRGFDKILTAFPLKTKHFSFYNYSSKPIQTNTNQQYSSKLNPTEPQNSFTTNTKLFLSTFGVFPNSNTNKRGLGFESYLKSLSNFNTMVPACFFITLAFDFHGAIHKSPHSKILALSLFLKNKNALMRGMSFKGQNMVFMSPIHKALFGFHTKSHFLKFSILTLHFTFISILFHLHFCTYTSHLGPLGTHLTFLPNLIGFCRIFRLHIFFVMSI